MVPGRTCENCAAYSALTNACRRKSPIMVPVQSPSGQGLAAMGLYPATEKDGWCMEWIAEEKTAMATALPTTRIVGQH